MDVFEYVTLAGRRTELVHLTREADDHRTLCGRMVPSDAAIGDETIVGLAATCKRCRQLMQALVQS